MAEVKRSKRSKKESKEVVPTSPERLWYGATMPALQSETFLLSGKVTIPEDLFSAVVKAWGPGGGGAGGSGGVLGVGGGAGAYAEAPVPLRPGDSYSLTVPPGGTGGMAGIGGALSPLMNGLPGGNGVSTAFVGPGQNWLVGFGNGGTIIPFGVSEVTIPGQGGSAFFLQGGNGGFTSNGQNGQLSVDSRFGFIGGNGGSATSGGAGGIGGNSTLYSTSPNPAFLASPGNLPGGGGAGGGGGAADGLTVDPPPNSLNGSAGAGGMITFTYLYPHPLDFKFEK